MQGWQRGARRRLRGVWSPNRKQRRVGGGIRPDARRGRCQAVQLDRRHGGRPNDRRDLALRAEPGARGERGGDRATRSRAGAATLMGLACEKPLARNVAEAKQVPRCPRRRGAHARLPREPGVRAAGGAGAFAALGPRRGDDRAALPGARRRRAQRPAHAVVLARRAAGRRRAQRHDVPLGARGAAAAHQAGRAALDGEAGADHRRTSRASSGPAPSTSSQLKTAMGTAGGLREAPVGGLRERDDRVRDQRRPHASWARRPPRGASSAPGSGSPPSCSVPSTR